MQPLRIKDWERALVEYTVAMLTDTQAKLKPPLEKRLQEIACPGNAVYSCTFFLLVALDKWNLDMRS